MPKLLKEGKGSPSAKYKIPMCSWFAFDNCWCTNERCHSLSLDTDLSMLRRAPHLSADAGRGILGHRQTGESRPQMLVLVGEVNPFRLTGKALQF